MRRLWGWELLPLLALPLLGAGYLLVQPAPVLALMCLAAAAACVSRLM